MDKILTVKNEVEVEHKVKDSRFIGNIRTVESIKEAENFISKIRNNYSDATHNVSGYKVGSGDESREYCNDDGEPAGSSGPPVLQAITGNDLTNTVIVVTRYFGGTELGIGGLVRAYGDTAQLAIEQAGIKELKPVYRLMVQGDYDLIGKILNQVESVEGKVLSTDYNNQGGKIFFLLPVEKIDHLQSKLDQVTGGKVKIHKEDLLYI